MDILDKLDDAEKQELELINKLQAIYTRSLQDPGEIYLHKGNRNTYRVKYPGEKNLHYLSKAQKSTIKNLVEKKYSARLIELHYRNLNRLRKVHKYYEKDCALRLDLEQFGPDIIDPLLLSDEKYVSWWESEPYEINTYLAEKKIITTHKGEVVRSKSEMVIANWLYDNQIPYRYECKLYLPITRKSIYPDFTVLNPRTREIFYIEYFGLMSNMDYLTDNLRKLTIYLKNGFFIGEQLLAFFESEGVPIDVNSIEKVLRHKLGLDKQR